MANGPAESETDAWPYEEDGGGERGVRCAEEGFDTGDGGEFADDRTQHRVGLLHAKRNSRCAWLVVATPHLVEQRTSVVHRRCWHAKLYFNPHSCIQRRIVFPGMLKRDPFGLEHSDHHVDQLWVGRF